MSYITSAQTTYAGACDATREQWTEQIKTKVQLYDVAARTHRSVVAIVMSADRARYCRWLATLWSVYCWLTISSVRGQYCCVTANCALVCCYGDETTMNVNASNAQDQS